MRQCGLLMSLVPCLIVVISLPQISIIVYRLWESLTMLIMTLGTTKYVIVGVVIGGMLGISIWPLVRWVTNYILLSYISSIMHSHFASCLVFTTSSTSHNAIVTHVPHVSFSPSFSCLRTPVPFDIIQASLSLITVQTLGPIPSITVTKTVSDEQEEDYNELPG